MSNAICNLFGTICNQVLHINTLSPIIAFESLTLQHLMATIVKHTKKYNPTFHNTPTPLHPKQGRKKGRTM